MGPPECPGKGGGRAEEENPLGSGKGNEPLHHSAHPMCQVSGAECRVGEKMVQRMLGNHPGPPRGSSSPGQIQSFNGKDRLLPWSQGQGKSVPNSREETAQGMI